MKHGFCFPIRPAVRFGWLILAAVVVTTGGACRLVPEHQQRERFHNPFPQLKTVAVLPFYNQSDNPTVDTDAVAAAYYESLQSIPGFEVIPVGVAAGGYEAFAAAHGEPTTGEAFQALARFLNVEAVVVGSVTDLDMHYPPRLAMTTRWYAANDGFHPIPAGYGLPWGTDAEKHIPRRVVREAEFEVARSQLATQTPIASSVEFDGGQPLPPAAGGNPPGWPDVTDLIPDPPQPPFAPEAVASVASSPSTRPVLSHTRMFRGDDPAFTGPLSDYVESGDDARPGGWRGYLRRSDDFVRYCCHRHITTMLESRGGADPSDFILAWPISRY